MQKLQINPDRLNQMLNQLAEIGQLPNGGVSRMAFTEADLQARQLVQDWMTEVGMTVTIDAAGNIIGRYDGQNPHLGSLATGSHIDTVPVAGRYDGCLGVLAGIEVVRVLQENSVRLQHPIEVIVFTDEESTMLGCKAIAGHLNLHPDHYRLANGRSIQTCLEKIGGNWDKIATAQRTAEDIVAFIELHVEQGGVLEHQQKSIGIVTGIVGQNRYVVTILGQPNHAGTTPMDLRQDALLAAAQIILAVNQIATDKPGDQVATVGFLEVLPNAPNIVAGKVELRVDMRDLSQDILNEMSTRLKGEIARIATVTNTEITIAPILPTTPTLSSPVIMQVIEQICQRANLDYLYLPSRAGHDAQEMGQLTQMAMIFVPSYAGISHSQDEFTTLAECVQGANVLLQTLCDLDDIVSHPQEL
jgi:beta-ureidopropionase / N-carbamoyl-L-amino-acid hydrolase